MSLFDNNIADTLLLVKNFYNVVFVRGPWDIFNEDYELVTKYFYKYTYNNDFYSAVENIITLIGNMPVELFNDCIRTGYIKPLKKKFKKLVKRSEHQHFKFVHINGNSLSVCFMVPIVLATGDIALEKYFSFDLRPL